MPFKSKNQIILNINGRFKSVVYLIVPACMFFFLSLIAWIHTYPLDPVHHLKISCLFKKAESLHKTYVSLKRNVYSWLFCLCCCLGLSLIVVSRGLLSICGALDPHCGSFSSCGVRALGTRASVLVAHRLSSYGLQALARGLSSYNTWA